MTIYNNSTIVHIPPSELSIHPDIADIPDLTEIHYESLKKSISIHGIKQALVADQSHAVFEGRARLKIALDLSLKTVPVILNDKETPLDFALESAVQGRQLTKLGRALLLLECHPLLAEGRKSRVGGRFIKTIKLADDPPVKESSFRSISEQYSVDRDYFTLLVEIKEACRAGTRDWEKVKEFVWAEEIGPTRLPAAVEGWRVTGTDSVAHGRAPADEFKLLRISLIRLKNFLPSWDKLDAENRAELRKMWLALGDVIPKEIKW